MSALLSGPPWTSNMPGIELRCMFRLTVLLGNESFSTQVQARGDGTPFLGRVESVELIQCKYTNVE